MAQTVKRLPTRRETRFQSLGGEDPLEKEMATHSRIPAWKIPWTEEPGRLQSMGSQRVRHNWATSLSLSFFRRMTNKTLISGFIHSPCPLVLVPYICTLIFWELILSLPCQSLLLAPSPTSHSLIIRLETVQGPCKLHLPILSKTATGQPQPFHLFIKMQTNK